MIARLTGVLEKTKDSVILDVNGVGYEVHVPETVLLKLPESKAPVTLQIYSHVREDQFTLYGFLTDLEKDVFKLLMTVNGIGPKASLSILSALEAIQILEGVVSGNKALFAGISGVGKKTVEKLLIEIREKAEKRLLLERGDSSGALGKKGGASASAHSNWTSDLEQALISMGYRESDVRVASREILKNDELKDFDAAFRAALQILSGGNKSKGVKGASL